jgi:hypothetical protein
VLGITNEGFASHARPFLLQTRDSGAGKPIWNVTEWKDLPSVAKTSQIDCLAKTAHNVN